MSREHGFSRVTARGARGFAYVAAMVGLSVSVFCTLRADAAPPGLIWTLEEPDTTQEAGAYCSYAVDGRGTPHIAYRSATERTVWYATRVGGDWVTEKIDRSWGEYDACWIDAIAMTLDDDGRPHVAFVNNFYDYDRDEDYGPHFIGYATKSAGSWTTTRIANCYPYGAYSGVAVAVTPQGCPAVLYIGNDWCNQGTLVLATRRGDPCGSWTSEAVPEDLSSCYTRFDLSLAFDRSGVAHASYRSCVERRVRYARRDTAGWTIENVGVEDAGSTYYPSLVLDSKGSPCISYARGATADLVYATRSGDMWSHSLVDTAGLDFSYATALALDRDDNPRIAYIQFMPGDRNLRYAGYNGAAWKVVDVEAAIVTGLSAAIDVDLAGIPSIVYDLPGGLFFRQLKAAVLPEANESSFAVANAPALSIEPNVLHLGGTRIVITGTLSTRCFADIFDASGRKVRTVELTREAAGSLGGVWDGSDADGSALAAGTYFVLARVGSTQLNSRITLIR